MQFTGDTIEDVRDYVNRKQYGDLELCFLLERFWPWQGDNPMEMSGMIYFVAMFRLLYCRLVPRDAMTDVIKKAGILRFAMSNFGAETAAEKDNEQAACRLMYDSLAEQIGGQPTFARLAESDLLLKSLWADDLFRLYHPIMWRSDPADTDWNCISEEMGEILEAKKGLIVWDTSKHATVDDALASMEGIFKGKLDGVSQDQVEFSLFFRSPLIVRVKVLFPDKIRDFSISDFANLHMPQTLVTSKRIGTGRGATTTRSLTFKRGTDGHDYRLMAVVRLRASESEKDRVRFYDTRGQLIVSNMERASPDGLLNDVWSVNDQDHSLMLYFLHTGGPSAAASYTNITHENSAQPTIHRRPLIVFGPHVSASGEGGSSAGPAPESSIIQGGVGSNFVSVGAPTDAGAKPALAQEPGLRKGRLEETDQQQPFASKGGQLVRPAKEIKRMGHSDSSDSYVTPEKKRAKTLAKEIGRIGHTDSPGSSPGPV